MAMVFTLVTHLREALVEVVGKRIEKEKQQELEKERQLMEVSMSFILIAIVYAALKSLG
jgi:hypothetical protein